MLCLSKAKETTNTLRISSSVIGGAKQMVLIIPHYFSYFF